MAAVKSLANGRDKVALSATPPADPDTVTLAEVTAALDASCRLAKNPFTLGPTTSETVNDPELCVDVNATVYGASNFEGQLAPFRYYDADTGLVDTIGDAVYQMLKTKGAELWIYHRFSAKKSTDPWAAGDEINVYRTLLDNPKQPTDRDGYIKRIVDLAIQDGYLDQIVPTAG